MSLARPVIDREDFVGQANGAFRAIATRLGSIARLDLPSALRSALIRRMSAAPFESVPAGGGVAYVDAALNSLLAA